MTVWLAGQYQQATEKMFIASFLPREAINFRFVSTRRKRKQ